MRRAKMYFTAAAFRYVAATGFFFGGMLGFTSWAQPAFLSSNSLPFVTNLLQLSKLIESNPRVVADVRLDMLACAASRPEIGVVAVMDETGSEVLELGSRIDALAARDIIHIEGRRFLFRRREMGIEVTRSPDIANDGTHGQRTVTAEVNLAAGFHPFQLDYFNFLGAYGLDLTCRLPDGSLQPASRFLVRSDNNRASEIKMVSGLNATYYDGTWLNVPDYAVLQPVKTGTITNLDLAMGSMRELSGIRFRGFFAAPVAGHYTFSLSSDDGTLLFLNTPEVPVTVIGNRDVPPPIASTLRARMTDYESPQWISVEGRVDFVSKSGRGFQFELRSQPDSIWVMVADASGLDPARLLNSRIQVAGIGRAATAPNRGRVLGELSVATSDNITMLEDSAGAKVTAGSDSALLTVDKIQSLSQEDATRRLPVRIQGVVTSIAPFLYHFMSIQDETRGIFVRLPASVESALVVGQYCEVVGYTAPGDFAPIVVADKVIVLGKGQMPAPAHPTWRELINGSMDVQWVELQGLVTAVQSNRLTLLLAEGEVEITAEARSESQLRTCENAVIRVRGALFAAWNTNRTVRVGQLLIRNAILAVDVPAPPDPFNVALKRWSELYQFDTRATPFQRVKVRGTAVYADSRGIFIMDQSRGIRVSPLKPASVQLGEEIEVVGYPDIGGPVPLLREAILRKTGKLMVPTARILSPGESTPAGYDSTLVQISAMLMGIHSEPDSQVLEMNAAGHLFVARLPRTTRPVSVRTGSQLAVIGVYVGKETTWSESNRPSGFELLVSSPLQVTVLSEPSWWTPQRSLVMVGLLLVSLALAAAWISQLHRIVEQRTQQLQREISERETAERGRALETERSRIARDLHDDLGSSLTEISVLANKGQRAGSLDELVALFRAIAAKARELVTALDAIVWAVDPADNSLESVADYLSDYAGEYLSHSGIACRFDIPVALPPIVLDGRLRHGLLLAVKETLNNVERHAQATEVEFRMALNEDQFQIVISDNGKGFEAGKKHGGNGLKNLPLRLSRLGGRYDIDSSIGKGTVVTIGLPIAPRTETIPEHSH